MPPLFKAILLIVLLPATAQADVVHLINGDRISGDLRQKEGATLVIETPYAGEIDIPWDQVAGLLTEGPILFELTDGTRLRATALQAPRGELRLRADSLVEAQPIHLSEVQAINPSLQEAPAVKFSGFTNASLSITEGNSRTRTYYFDAEMVARTEHNRYTLGGAFNHAEDEEETTEESTQAYMKYDQFLTQRQYLYANAQFFKDRFRDLNLRTTLGVGTGYQVFEGERLNLALEGGLSYVSEDFIDAEDEDYPAARWGLRYDQFIFDSGAKFFHNHDFLVGLSDTEDMYLNAQTGLRFPLVEQLNATFQVDHQWDNTPAPGNKRLDTHYRAGVGYTW